MSEKVSIDEMQRSIRSWSYLQENTSTVAKEYMDEIFRLARLGARFETILCSSCGGDGYPRNGCHTFESKTECGDCYGSGLASNEKRPAR